jgi:hypothetical protein
MKRKGNLSRGITRAAAALHARSPMVTYVFHSKVRRGESLGVMGLFTPVVLLSPPLVNCNDDHAEVSFTYSCLRGEQWPHSVPLRMSDIEPKE